MTLGRGPELPLLRESGQAWGSLKCFSVLLKPAQLSFVFITFTLSFCSVYDVSISFEN